MKYCAQIIIILGFMIFSGVNTTSAAETVTLNPLHGKPFTKLRVYVQSYPSGDSKLLEGQKEAASKVFSESVDSEMVDQNDVITVLGDRLPSYNGMEEDNWELAKKIGNGLHADYVIIANRSAQMGYVTLSLAMINAHTGKLFAVQNKKTSDSTVIDLDQDSDLPRFYRDNYLELVRNAKTDMQETDRKCKAKARLVAEHKEAVPPTISITKPDITKEVRLEATQMAVEGKVTAAGEIEEVTINDTVVQVSEDGSFRLELPLKIGGNKITITAFDDIWGTRAARSFSVERERRTAYLNDKVRIFTMFYPASDNEFVSDQQRLANAALAETNGAEAAGNADGLDATFRKRISSYEEVEKNDWALAKDAGSFIEADYVMIVCRSASSFKIAMINVQSGESISTSRSLFNNSAFLGGSENTDWEKVFKSAYSEILLKSQKGFSAVVALKKQYLEARQKRIADEEQKRVAEELRKKKEIDDELVSCGTASNTDQYYGFLEKYLDEALRQKAYTALCNFIKDKPNPETEYLKLVQAYPDAIGYIPTDYQIRFIGPQGMTVNDIIMYSKEGLSDGLIASKIKASRGSYKNFELSEINTLKKCGLSDLVIQAMIDKTAETMRANDDLQKKSEMEDLLAEIKRMQVKLDQLKAAQAQQQQQPVQEASANGTSAGTVVKNCTAQLVALEACKRLPSFGAMICKAAAKSQFPCD